jgi:hypothetical protein
MKKLIALGLLLPVATLAASLFDGTWKTRLDSLRVSGKPEIYELSGGVYECRSCVPSYRVKADGTDQAVPPQEYRDHVAVKILSSTSIEVTEKKADKVVVTLTQNVSADGTTVTGTFVNYSGATPVTGSYTDKRVAPGPQGSHPISGSWMQESIGSLSDAARILTLQSTLNGLKMSWNGQITDAKFDGSAYPTVGDLGDTMVTLKKLSDSQFEETDRRQGKVHDVIVWTVARDGKTITFVDTDPVHETRTTMVLDKQP